MTEHAATPPSPANGVPQALARLLNTSPSPPPERAHEAPAPPTGQVRELRICTIERTGGWAIGVSLRSGRARDGQPWTTIRLRMRHRGRDTPMRFDLRPNDIRTLAALIPASISALLQRYGDELHEQPLHDDDDLHPEKASAPE